ncbi:MAG: energy transducer TonB [Saprospiraceae bacterium]|nr:energy transducer TonB [Saprospiraceae bacterium]HRG68791.1 energy transducer TonB [Saprospiraceae bacterium]
MKKVKKHKNFIPQPEFLGGPKGITDFIYRELKYPDEAMLHKIEGTVVLKAEINYKGEIIDVKIISSLHPVCDEEAKRVVKLLKFKIEKVRDIKVSFFKTFNIKFKMPPKSNELLLNYSIVQSDKNLTNPASKKLNYKITLG